VVSEEFQVMLKGNALDGFPAKFSSLRRHRLFV
jgi:hypothetical protein